MLDEVQKIPRLLDVVHHHIETSNLKFALTGSSARKLKRGAANLLAGRAFVNHLFPLTHIEMGDTFDEMAAMKFGALPKTTSLQNNDEKVAFLKAYALTYLKEEVWVEHIVRNLDPFRKFLEIAAQCNGEVINYTNIARDVGADTKTVQSYFQILEDTLLGFWLKPYGKTVRRKLAKHPKFYFFDTGVLRALKKTLKVPVEPRTAAFGDLFENFIVNEVMRLNSYHRLDYKFCFYRTDAGAEVDLIIQRPGKPALALEIKSTNRPSSSDCRGLLSFAEILPSAELSLVCLIDHPQLFRFGKRSVRAQPWRECLRRLAS